MHRLQAHLQFRRLSGNARRLLTRQVQVGRGRTQRQQRERGQRKSRPSWTIQPLVGWRCGVRRWPISLELSGRERKRQRGRATVDRHTRRGRRRGRSGQGARLSSLSCQSSACNHYTMHTSFCLGAIPRWYLGSRNANAAGTKTLQRETRNTVRYGCGRSAIGGLAT